MTKRTLNLDLPQTRVCGHGIWWQHREVAHGIHEWRVWEYFDNEGFCDVYLPDELRGEITAVHVNGISLSEREIQLDRCGAVLCIEGPEATRAGVVVTVYSPDAPNQI